MRAADAAERARLQDTFAALCRIDSPSRRERACADRVAGELRALGLEVSEDGVAAELGGDAGNLLARIPAAAGSRAERGILLCAHLDTVPAGGPIEPRLVDGIWRSGGDTILGADNKAAVAMLLAVAGRCVAEPPPIPLELLFTVAEEEGLRGAAAFDAGSLRSAFGYVFDHATPIGEIVVASPTYHRIEAELVGASAHAGIRPETGRSAIAAAAHAIGAMRLGRIDSETTANVGTIAGGSAANVVPERCRVEAEVRGIDERRAEQLVSEIVDRFSDGAAAAECDVDVVVERVFAGYRMRRTEPAVLAAEAALRARGREPRQIATGGGSDANALIAAGLQCVNLANGTEHNHEPGELVSAAALDGMLDVTLALIDEAAQRC